MTETIQPTTDDAIERLSFDEALAELQRTVAELEAGGQPLEASLALYERGVALQQHCDRLLRDAELRVQQLVARAGLETATAALDVLAPQRTLERGYAIVRRSADGTIVRDPREAPAGTRLAVRVAAGDLPATVDPS